MKSKLVLWGKNPEGKRALLALSLHDEDKVVHIHAIAEESITEDLENTLNNSWKQGEEVTFPEGTVHLKRELSLISNLLPDGYTAEREDLVKRAQTEWHFMVLSSRLYMTYASELEEIKDRIERQETYGNHLWDELKGFWDKVQTQIVEKNILREHSNQLREITNSLFGTLKEMRKDLDRQFNEASKGNFESFQSKLEDIDQKISNGISLNVIFDQLKRLQNDFKNLKLSKDHRNKLWAKLDEQFKLVKEKRYGDGSASENSALSRLENRLKGLEEAINKMEKSIKRDRQERDQQSRGSDSVFGQLEAQLREAKTKMIDERIASKDLKLQDMIKTREELEARKKNIVAREEKERAIVEAKKAAEAKIAAEIKEAAENRKDEEEKLEKLAAEIVAPKATLEQPVASEEDQVTGEEE
jgi:hypothetical protein